MLLALPSDERFLLLPTLAPGESEHIWRGTAGELLGEAFNRLGSVLPSGVKLSLSRFSIVADRTMTIGDGIW